MAYIQSVTPEVYAKSTYNVCYLRSGDASIGTFFGVSRLLWEHVDPYKLGTQSLASWEAIFTGLYQFNKDGVEIPVILAEYCRLATHFFEHPYWSRLQPLREYLSVEKVGLI